MVAEAITSYGPALSLALTGAAAAIALYSLWIAHTKMGSAKLDLELAEQNVHLSLQNEATMAVIERHDFAEEVREERAIILEENPEVRETIADIRERRESEEENEVVEP